MPPANYETETAVPQPPTLDRIVALAKRRGFVFPTSEIGVARKKWEPHPS